ncbi:MAG TPA: TetR/AcrR family transcriptional regulator [Terriglobales bacterium]|nr:TetR/AcrR family transcriptional regulator [Terriglobales bacterium]
MRTQATHRLGSRGQPEESRAAILQAAAQEFAREGIAGARTDAIARSAHVNKALLYYYFKDKESLYRAVLDHVFSGLAETINAAFESNLPPREKILAYAGAHFDYIANHALYPRIVHAELTRARAGNTAQFERIVQQYFRPLFGKIASVLREGQMTADFRQVDPMQFIPSMISVIVFYFNTVPVIKLMTGEDPLTPERLAERRAAVLDFISAALFMSPLNSTVSSSVTSSGVRKGERK